MLKCNAQDVKTEVRKKKDEKLYGEKLCEEAAVVSYLLADG